ncbi:putative serine/threonine-protein phosphatase 6 regulatory ankyrin repeat subunit C-like 3 [Homarus americanus]|uniref:Putative serine/threonine-protein phosphatase 6 regulatory ankyrin repeat subunit C-like 3 n=1 Tax=Homarus americanus TaxID=6706 RepID=A0A8J5NE21_HOMAM|nr:putative serine/threonine-protein phosphatase 6 regulatory ankyrin repeat subunit C-like 3 [Homarus americanus]
MAQGLEAERRRVGQDSALGEGIDHLVRSLRGATTWVTSWPLPHTNLTSLMVVAATNNCPLTASFLRQAGAKCYLQDDSGTTPLHAALDRQHWHLATLMVKHMRACLYIPSLRQAAPTPVASTPQNTSGTGESIYQEERQHLEELIEKVKDKEEKEQLREVVDEYDGLFIRYQAAAAQPPPVTSPHRLTILSYSLLVSCRRGLLQLTYLLVTVVGVKVDVVVDAT